MIKRLLWLNFLNLHIISSVTSLFHLLCFSKTFRCLWSEHGQLECLTLTTYFSYSRPSTFWTRQYMHVLYFNSDKQNSLSLHSNIKLIVLFMKWRNLFMFVVVSYFNRACNCTWITMFGSFTHQKQKRFEGGFLWCGC